ncbi:MAG: hypothetical protein IPN72_08770 [Saprospiraceae bacterium]|nr:hypothetical protein [Saprospiraceae bacterium]
MEIYKATGDKAWLDEVYPIIKNSLETITKLFMMLNLKDLYLQESSFLDWRRTNYPKWMDQSQIFMDLTIWEQMSYIIRHTRILAEMAKLKAKMERFTTIG